MIGEHTRGNVEISWNFAQLISNSAARIHKRKIQPIIRVLNRMKIHCWPQTQVFFCLCLIDIESHTFFNGSSP